MAKAGSRVGRLLLKQRCQFQTLVRFTPPARFLGCLSFRRWLDERQVSNFLGVRVCFFRHTFTVRYFKPL